ncbi:unnamed protein product [Lasius platythorax]|uniref:Uncharacterized protein n=1 Tax=Lasius platythorax TaxID=488582 RepID=A0AAV2NFN4_9HYME
MTEVQCATQAKNFAHLFSRILEYFGSLSAVRRSVHRLSPGSDCNKKNGTGLREERRFGFFFEARDRGMKDEPSFTRLPDYALGSAPKILK